MSSKNKLSIFLIKNEITDIKDVFKDFDNIKEFNKYDENSVAYYLPSYIHEPAWMKGFFRENGKGLIQQSSARLVLMKKLKIGKEERFFALTFGYSKYMFQDDVLEEQFGLKIILNSIENDQIR